MGQDVKNWASWNQSLNLPSGGQEGVSALGPPQTPPSEESHLGQEDAVTESPLCLPHWEGRKTLRRETATHVSTLPLEASVSPSVN